MSGKIIIKLDNYLKQHNISRTSVARNGDLRYDTVLSYCRGNIVRLDTDTLSKLCSVLHCKIQDIIEYFPDDSN